MKTLLARLLLGTLLLLALTTGIAWAWPEEPFAKIEISGPGITGIATITEAELLKSMTIGGFMNYDRYITEPQGLGEGYELHRYFLNKDGSWWDFDRVMYYSDPAGGPGYVKYLEGIGYGPAHNAGYWFRVTPEGEAAWQAIMQSTLQSITVPAPGTAPLLAFIVLATLLVLGGLLFLLKPRSVVAKHRA